MSAVLDEMRAAADDLRSASDLPAVNRANRRMSKAIRALNRELPMMTRREAAQVEAVLSDAQDASMKMMAAVLKMGDSTATKGPRP